MQSLYPKASCLRPDRERQDQCATEPSDPVLSGASMAGTGADAGRRCVCAVTTRDTRALVDTLFDTLRASAVGLFALVSSFPLHYWPV